jgi:hypothetical protein
MGGNFQHQVGDRHFDRTTKDWRSTISVRCHSIAMRPSIQGRLAPG